MFLIAQRFGVSLNALIAANPQIPNPNLIFPGQQVCVPPIIPVPPEPPFIQHLRTFINSHIRVVLMGGQTGGPSFDFNGTLQAVFTDHILLMVDSAQRHIRIDAIAWFEPLLTS